MFFGLDAGVRQMIDFHFQPHLFACRFHKVRDVENRKALRKLVEHAALAGLGGIEAVQLDAPDGISNIEKAARLPSAAVHSEGRSNRRLHAKAVQNRAEPLVETKRIVRALTRRDSSVPVATNN